MSYLLLQNGADRLLLQDGGGDLLLQLTSGGAAAIGDVAMLYWFSVWW